jgi:hypothetical protein
VGLVEVGCGAYDRVETGESGADGETGETRFGDGRVDNSLLAEAVEQALGDLVAESGGLAGARGWIAGRGLTLRCTGRPPHPEQRPCRFSPSPRPWPRSGPL